jgi:hypothetical protein
MLKVTLISRDKIATKWYVMFPFSCAVGYRDGKMEFSCAVGYRGGKMEFSPRQQRDQKC